jgi:hypothetical protein
MDISPVQAESFVKYYNTYAVFSGADAKQTGASGYAALGTVESYTSGTQICLLRMDAFGNLLDSARYYGRSLNDQAYCLQVLTDGYAILGSSQNPSTGKSEVYFVRTNLAGDVLWTRIIGAAENVEATHFEVSPAGSFYLTGYVITEKLGVLNKDLWLFGFDSEGNNIADWEAPRIIGGNKDDEGTHLQLMSDGKIAITGYTRSYPSGTLYSQAFIIITNATGGLSIFAYTTNEWNEQANCIRVLGTNSYLLTGTSSALTTSSTDIMLKKVSLSGSNIQVAWEKSFGGSGNDYGTCAQIKNNAIYLLATKATAGINSSIAVITTNIDGANERYMYFGENSQMSASTLENTEDEGFIISGTNKHSDNDISLALIKTRPDTSL